MTIAANDTTAPTFTAGATVETASWRVGRGMSSLNVMSLVNAGKRGKSCEVFAVYDATTETLEAILPSVLWAAEEGVSVPAMRALCEDVTLLGAKFSASEQRGVDVAKRPELRVTAEMVRGFFGETEFNLSFSFWIGGKVGGLKHDYSVCSVKRQDAAKAYAWASDAANMDRLPTMTRAAFLSEMSAIGVRVS